MTRFDAGDYIKLIPVSDQLFLDRSRSYGLSGAQDVAALAGKKLVVSALVNEDAFQYVVDIIHPDNRHERFGWVIDDSIVEPWREDNQFLIEEK